MSRLIRILSKLNNLFRNNRAEEELAREITSHLTLLADDFERRGMSPEEARLAAKRAYGGVEQAKQAHRDERYPYLGWSRRYRICAMHCVCWQDRRALPPQRFLHWRSASAPTPLSSA